MTLPELVERELERSGLREATFSGTDEAVARMTSCVSGVVTSLVTSLARTKPGVAFEIDVGGEYDAPRHEAEIEATVAMRYPDDNAGVGISFALLSHGFRYFAEQDVFNVTLTLKLRRA